MLLCPRNSPSKNTGVSYHAFLHRIFPGIKPVSLMSPALGGGLFTSKCHLEGDLSGGPVMKTALSM